jgi:hypothetical protein
MKIRMLKSVVVDVEKPRLQEIWDKQLHRWDELNVEAINYSGKYAYITTYEGDTYLHVPSDSFEAMQ